MSILLAGNSTSNLTIPANNLIIGTNQFTIEWWQYQTDSKLYPRVFSVGNYSTAQLAVSIEGGTFYFWRMGSNTAFGSVTPFKNQWVHFAITRDASNVLRAFKNGVRFGSTPTITTNFTQSLAFTIGNETSTSDDASFGGNITNFRIVIGSAVYTSNFTPPTTPLTAISGTALLLLASSAPTVATDSSSSPKTVTANNISWSSLSPITAPPSISTIGWLTSVTFAVPNATIASYVSANNVSGNILNTNDLNATSLDTNILRVSGTVNTEDVLITEEINIGILDTVKSGIMGSYSALGSMAYMETFILTNGTRFGIIELNASYLSFKYTKPADTTIYSYNLIAFN